MDKKTLREAQSKISQARSFIEVIRDDAIETYDGKDEKWQESPAGEKLNEIVETLNEAVEALDTADSSIEQAMQD